jgi:transcriptional regulator with XRE-family HTH domain
MTLTSAPRRQISARPTSSPGWSRRHGRLQHVPAVSGQPYAGYAGNQSKHASPAGVIGGAVIAAARRSAGLSRRALARRLAVTPATVRAWETGALPLYCVSYDQLRELAYQLSESGALASPALDDLLLASQCDLLVAGMLNGFEDYGEVPPVDDESAGEPARGLLRWALTGDVPEQYRRHAQAGRLLARADIDRFRALARDLATGTQGPELSEYGVALESVSAARPGPNTSRRTRARRGNRSSPRRDDDLDSHA